MTRCTCHTDGCENADIPIDLELTWTDEEGTEHTTTSVQCGPCGQPITDLEPVESEPES